MKKNTLLIFLFLCCILPTISHAGLHGSGTGSVFVRDLANDQLRVEVIWTMESGYGSFGPVIEADRNMIDRHDRVIFFFRNTLSQNTYFPEKNSMCTLSHSNVSQTYYAPYRESGLMATFVFSGKTCLNEINKLQSLRYIELRIFEKGYEFSSYDLSGIIL